jgi:thiol-disulfide isomerase/thioredoxin
MFKKLIHDSSNTRRRGSGKWIGFVLIMAVGAACLTMAPCACKPRTEPAPAEQRRPAASTVAPTEAAATDAAPQKQKLPRLLDLGAHSCIPCKMMAPILDELKKDYADGFKTEFIDVWQNPDAGKLYGIQSIPTQIFFDTEGKELFRHMGFFSKEDILDTWKKHGVDVERK